MNQLTEFLALYVHTLDPEELVDLQEQINDDIFDSVSELADVLEDDYDIDLDDVYILPSGDLDPISRHYSSFLSQKVLT